MSPTLHPGQVVVETARLRLHAMSDADDDDAALMLALLNDAAFIRHIADRGVRTLDQARAYLRTGALRSYSENGFGMYAVRRKDTGALIGNCGLVLRDGLEGPDLGYALLPAHAGQGFARRPRTPSSPTPPAASASSACMPSSIPTTWPRSACCRNWDSHSTE